MHESVYVLTVETFVFGLLGVLLVAQRLDVAQFPAGTAWPVFSSCIVLMLAYAQVLLALCCAIAIGQFGALAHGMMDACARSAGRLASAAVLTVCYVAALLLISNNTGSAKLLPEQNSVQCLLAQLCGTICASDGPVLWSYGVYLAVLLPVWALVASLQVTAAGMCKDESRPAHGRLLCINIAYLLTYHVNYTLLMNVKCNQACHGAAVTQQPTLIECKEVLFFVGALCASDMVAETVLVRKTLSLSRLFRVLLRIQVNFLPGIPSADVFCLLRLGQLLAVFFFNFRAATPLPSQLLVAHMSLASVMCLLDIVEVFVRSGSAPNTPNTSEISAQQTVPTQNADAGGQAVVQLPRSNKAFEVESGNRRKFMMTFTGRSRWPSMLNVPTVKKTT